jgi:hypothetical protein
MPVGTDTWCGAAEPLNGCCEIIQDVAATDMRTYTGAASMSGDFLVGRNSAEVEKWYIGCDGNAYFGGDTTNGVTTAGGTTLVYGYGYHKTNALTGDLIGVRGNARVVVASAAGTVIGGKFQAGNGTSATSSDGVNVGELNGALVEVINVPGTATITKAVGLNVVADMNQATAATTSLFGLRIALQSGASQGTVSAGTGLVIINENVQGAGSAWNAAIAIGQISRAAGWTVGLNLAPSIADGGNGTIGASSFSTADIRLSNSVDIYAASAATTIKANADDDVLSLGISAATQKSFDLRWYGEGANGADYLYFDASANKVYTLGGIYAQFGENATGVTTAGGTTMLYGYAYHKTNALTGDLIGVRGNARITVASAAGSAYGGKFQAGSGSSATGADAVNSGLLCGSLSEVVVAAASATVTLACGSQVNMDIDAATTAITSSIGQLVSIQTGASQGTHTSSVGVLIMNESVAGAGTICQAGLAIGTISMTTGFTYLIDLGPTVAVGSRGSAVACSGHSADIRFSNGCWFVALTGTITANSTTTSAPAGSIGITSGTGSEHSYRSDGLMPTFGPSKITANLRRTLKSQRPASKAMWPVQQQRLSAVSGWAYA